MLRVDYGKEQKHIKDSHIIGLHRFEEGEITAPLIIELKTKSKQIQQAGLMRLYSPKPATDQTRGLEGFISGMRVSYLYLVNVVNFWFWCPVNQWFGEQIKR